MYVNTVLSHIWDSQAECYGVTIEGGSSWNARAFPFAKQTSPRKARQFVQNCVVSPQSILDCGGCFVFWYAWRMGYAILRIQKIKHSGGLHRSLKHGFREQETPNADSKLSASNDKIGASNSAEVMEKFRLAMPAKVRKNAVLAVEYLITASPESMKSKDRKGQDSYFSDALDWLKTKHGADNVLFAGVHRDETTPHMYAYVVPKVNGKLNARHFFGGVHALKELQTDFAATVGALHGFERGIEGSKARHTSIKDYYKRVNEPLPKLYAPELPETSFFESKPDYATRAISPVIDMANKRLDAVHLKNKELERINSVQANELKAFETIRPLRNAFDRLPPSSANRYAVTLAKGITEGLDKQDKAKLDASRRDSETAAAEGARARKQELDRQATAVPVKTTAAEDAAQFDLAVTKTTQGWSR